jgi:lipoteichoic acid synthase
MERRYLAVRGIGLQILRSPFVLFTWFMIMKSLYVRYWMYEDTFWNVVAVELSAFLFLFGLVELTCRKSKNVVHFLLNFLLSTAYLAILVYDRQFNRIPLMDSLLLLGEAESVHDSIYTLLEPSDVLMYMDLVLVLLLKLFGRNAFSHAAFLQRKYLAVLLVASLFISGGNAFAKGSQDVLDSSKLAEDIGLLNAEVYQAIQGNRNKVVDTGPVTQQGINQIKGIEEPTQPKYFGVAQNKNLIVIQLESVQNLLVGLKIDGQEVTPNLNRLAGESLYFDHFNTMIGQGNTSDAEFITNTSLYPLENGAVSKTYTNKDFPSLPKLLESHGYDTFTMHVNDVSFYNRDRMYPNLGYNQYYDKSYFGEEDVIGLGASDNVLFGKSLPLLLERKNSSQPFYANYVTLTSHHPFELPEGADGLQLPAEYQGTLLGNYLQAVHYTDQAMGAFFDQLKANGLWDQTVIAVYGDHFAFHAESADETDKKLLSNLLGRSYDQADMLNIPMVMHVPGVKPQVVEQLGGQVDTLPTLANLLGVPLESQIHFGEDLLNQSSNVLGEMYYFTTGSFLQDDSLYLSKDNVAIDLKTRERSQAAESYQARMSQVIQLERMSTSYIDKLPRSPMK